MKKLLISLILLCSIFTLITPETALATDILDSGVFGNGYSNLSYTLDNDGVLTISGVGEMSQYNYKYYDYKVSDTPWYAHRYRISSVIINDGVTNIGQGAFADCTNLLSISIPSSIATIKSGAFCGCSNLDSVAIPNGVEEIWADVFRDCNNLSRISISGSVTYIADSALWNCNKLSEIEIDERNENYCSLDGVLFTKDLSELLRYPSQHSGNFYSIPDGVSKICGYAFGGSNNLSSISFPDTLTNIGEGAFDECFNLSNINNFDNLSYVGPNSFNDTAFFNHKGNWDNGSLYIGHCLIASDRTIPYYYTVREGTVCIASYSFSANSSLKSISIPDTVKQIDSYAFSGCTNLSTLKIPNSVTSIGSYAFSGCDALLDVKMSNNVTFIPRGAFWGCHNLAYITIPANLTISTYAFSYCTSLESIIILNTGTNRLRINVLAFDGCNTLSNIYFSGDKSEIRITNEGANGNFTRANWHYNSTGPESMSYGGVMFITDWDNATKSVTFADSPFKYYVTDKTNLSFLASWPENCYTYVQVTADHYNLIDIQPVESHIGVVSVATGRNLTINGVTYPVAGSAQLILSSYVGRPVLYHLSNGVIVDLEYAASMDEGEYKIKTGGAGQIYVDLKCLPGDTVSWKFTTSDSSIVSFDPNGNDLDTTMSLTLTGAYQAYRGIHDAITFYALRPGTATITCATSDGISLSRDIVVQSNGTGAIVSNYYNVPEYEKTEEEQARDELWDLYRDVSDAYEEFCNAYAQAIIEEAEAQGYDPTGGYTAQAEEMMRRDTKGEYLNFPNPFDDTLKVYAYRALCQMIDEVGELKGVDFSSVSFSDDFSLGSSVVNQIVSQIKSYKETIPMGDVEVEIYCGIFIRNDNRLGVMKVRRVTGGPTYDVFLLPNEAIAGEVVEQYLSSLQTLGKSAVKNAYTTVVKELTGLSLSSMNEKLMADALKRLNNKFSKVIIKGFDVEEVLTTLENSYNHYNECKKLATVKYSANMLNTTKSSLEKIINFDPLNPVDFETTAATKNAAKKLSEAERRLFTALEEYFYEGKISDETLGKINKNPFTWLWSGKCPIAIEVYDGNNNRIGYANDEIWFAEDILIERSGEEIRVYSNEPVSVRAVGTDFGTMSFTVEEFADGKPVGRINYYDVPLQENKSYTVSLMAASLSGADDVRMTDDAGISIDPFEFIPVGMNAKVQIDAESELDESGTIVGGGNYIKGDMVSLSAYANNGYRFVGWFNDDSCVSISENYTFVARDDMSLTAQFVEVYPSFEDYNVNVSAQYQSVYKVEVEQEGYEFTVHVTELATVSADGNVTVYFASYEPDGRMNSIEALQSVKTSTGVDFSGTVNDYGCKLFILDNNSCPITEAFISK